MFILSCVKVLFIVLCLHVISTLATYSEDYYDQDRQSEFDTSDEKKTVDNNKNQQIKNYFERNQGNQPNAGSLTQFSNSGYGGSGVYSLYTTTTTPRLPIVKVPPTYSEPNPNLNQKVIYNPNHHPDRYFQTSTDNYGWHQPHQPPTTSIYYQTPRTTTINSDTWQYTNPSTTTNRYYQTTRTTTTDSNVWQPSSRSTTTTEAYYYPGQQYPDKTDNSGSFSANYPQQSSHNYSRPHVKNPIKFPFMSDFTKKDQEQHYLDQEEQISCTDPEGKSGICQRSHVKCAAFYTQFILSKNTKKIHCRLSDGSVNGICCPAIYYTKGADLIKKTTIDVRVSTRVNNELGSELKNAVRNSEDALKEYDETEIRLLREKKNICQRGTPSHGHLQFFMTTGRAITTSKFGYGLQQCSKNIKARMELNDNEAGIGLQKFSMYQSSMSNECLPRPTCDLEYNFYRTIDGSCNNFETPNIGMSLTPLSRIVPPQYSDGLWKPRVSTETGYDLPSARLLSANIIRDQNFPHNYLSLNVMQFGQFVDHDLSSTPIYRYSNLSGIECCANEGRAFLPERERHPECLPIEIPDDDYFYRAHRQKCMNFVRSMVGPRLDCSLGYADQLNQVTHYLDSSNVYGSTPSREISLRHLKDGLLRATQLSAFDRKQMLPKSDRVGDECNHPGNTTSCFHAGDFRVNEMIGLTAVHLVWLREHNRIATELKNLNPAWNDDQLFYEARRILSAEYQHIIYNEWLPIVVGRKYMEVYGLLPLTDGFSKDYNNKIDPSVSNAFSTAAFRMGHTLIQGLIKLNEQNREEDIIIHEHFNNPFQIEEEGTLDKLLKALSTQPIQSYDTFVTSEITNRLFQPPRSQFGMDLIALNIQRGRDHGLPGYNAYRDICQLGRAEKFEDFSDWIPSNVIKQLELQYASVDDVDLFIGGISEKSVPGALLGPTFTCIIGDQFARSKKSDRFTYDLGGQQHSFTPAQLKEIRKASFSRILCDNGDRIRQMQPLAFYLVHSGFNPIVDCSDQRIPTVDLTMWNYR